MLSRSSLRSEGLPRLPKGAVSTAQERPTPELRSGLRRHRWVVAAAFGLRLGAPTAARAEDSALADSLFTAAKAHAAADEWAMACPKFEASLEASFALGTLINLAHCWDKVDRVVTAKARFEEAQKLAQETKDDRLAYIEEQLLALGPRQSALRLNAVLGAESLAVRVAGKPFSALGVPTPIDPGTVELEVLRGDEVLERKTVDVKIGQTTEFTLDLAAIAKAHPAPASRVEPNDVDPTQRHVGIAILSTGVAGLTGFLVTEGIVFGLRGELEEERGCVKQASGGFACSGDAYVLATQYSVAAEVAQWVGVGSLAFAAVGITVLVTAPTEAPTKPSARLEFRGGPGHSELNLVGTF